MYFGSWSSKEDICDSFQIDNFDGNVIYAVYDNEGYDGSASVIFVNNGKFYVAGG